MTVPSNVSGAWRGVRRRPERSLDVPFFATLTEDDAGRITGMIEEADVEDLTGGGTLYLAVDGHRRDEMVIFVATTENAREPRAPMQFVGSLRPDGAVGGAWVLAAAGAQNRSGTFEMETVATGVSEPRGRFLPSPDCHQFRVWPSHAGDAHLRDLQPLLQADGHFRTG